MCRFPYGGIDGENVSASCGETNLHVLVEPTRNGSFHPRPPYSEILAERRERRHMQTLQPNPQPKSSYKHRHSHTPDSVSLQSRYPTHSASALSSNAEYLGDVEKGMCGLRHIWINGFDQNNSLQFSQPSHSSSLI
jgi:hypothetical protein